MRRRHLLPACLFACAAAQGAQIDVRVTDLRGRPVPDAVIELVHEGGAGTPRPPPPRERIVDQRAEQFLPYVEIFRPGDSVVFTNSDDTRHHVYSFSPAKQFEFVLAPGERSPPQVLETPGDIAVGCNIHDFMVTYLHVTAAPWAARTDANGKAAFDALPAGPIRVHAWHPQLRPGKEPRPVPLALDGDGARAATRFTLDLLPDPRGERDPERSDY